MLAQDPDSFDGLHLLGLLEAQLGRPESGLPFLDRAIAVDPRSGMAHFNRGRLLQSLGRHTDALEAMDKTLTMAAGHGRAWLVKAQLQTQLGRREEAIATLAAARQTMADDPGMQLEIGGMLFGFKRYQDALDCFTRAASLAPRNVDAIINAGSALQKLSRSAEALDMFDAALAAGADSADVHFNKGLALAALGRHEAAVHSFGQALRRDPGLQAALRSRATCLRALGQLEAALSDFDTALKLAPRVAQGYADRAGVLFDMSRLEEAAAAYETALALDAQLDFAAEGLLQVRMAMCDWRDFDGQLARLERRIREGRLVAPALTLPVLTSPQLQRQCAQTYAAAFYPAEAAAPITAAAVGGRRLRIGYFSADFFEHATAYLMAGVFEEHDRSRFEVFAFSFGPAREDPMRERLRAAFEHFIELGSRTDEEVVALSRQLGIDIAIDLKGLTQGGRPRIFALRAAPVQLAYLGYPCTMGSPCFDYLVADPVVAGDDSWFTEKVLCLPDSYQANDDTRAVAPAVPSREDLQLPAGGFVFCSFNNAYKITPAVFAVWLRLLQAVEGSVLWLLQPGPVALRNLLALAAAQGVGPQRFVVAERLPLPQHLARHAAADLFLDTLPCNAHTTASDALWAGLPVLTCQGQTFTGRVAASLARAAGLGELVTDSLEAYEAAALALAQHPEKLGVLRSRLAANRRTCALFDTARFTRHLENAYVMAYEATRDGNQARRLAVPALRPAKDDVQ